ncbi:MAG: cytochrome c oxidase assembly protein [Acidimicrobiia bacterium]|nr:cytochrome c oxidase assembly protein [Acidimicrobiia bacterium]
MVESPWAWEARPDVWLLIVSLGMGYWWSVTRLRRKLALPPAAPSKKTIIQFAAGLIVLWLAADWPLDRLGDDFLFSAHVVQFLLITMAAAPLLVCGVPTWLQVELVWPIRRMLAAVTRAPVSLGLFQTVLVVTHLPAVVELYSSNSLVHFSLHALWLLSGCLFWLPLLGSEPVVRPLSSPVKIVYLIAATVVPTIPAGFLTWTQSAFYASYASAPRVWGISPTTDLQLAGAIMKLGGGTILWAHILFVFIGWASADQHERLASRTSGASGASPTESPIRARID